MSLKSPGAASIDVIPLGISFRPVTFKLESVHTIRIVGHPLIRGPNVFLTVRSPYCAALGSKFKAQEVPKTRVGVDNAIRHLSVFLGAVQVHPSNVIIASHAKYVRTVCAIALSAQRPSQGFRMQGWSI